MQKSKSRSETFNKNYIHPCMKKKLKFVDIVTISVVYLAHCCHTILVSTACPVSWKKYVGNVYNKNNNNKENTTFIIVYPSSTIV